MLEPPQSAAASGDHFAIIVWGLVAVLVVTIPALVALISTNRKTARTAADVAEVKHEVKNHHPKNLRAEQDERHDENKAALSRLEKKVDRVLGILGEHDYRIDELEHTLDPRKGLHPPP